jgi:glucose-1-phosphate cytidylyltransferase
MKAVILAGGLGSRLAEETSIKPKPMVEIGGMPILWHIMKSYSAYGINDFIVCLGYKGHMVKEFFANYFLYSSDLVSAKFPLSHAAISAAQLLDCEALLCSV